MLIVDIRHKPTADDVTMHDWFRQTGCPEIIVANKLDKLKKSQVEPALQLIRETLELTEEDAGYLFPRKKGGEGHPHPAADGKMGRMNKTRERQKPFPSFCLSGQPVVFPAGKPTRAGNSFVYPLCK